MKYSLAEDAFDLLRAGWGGTGDDHWGIGVLHHELFYKLSSSERFSDGHSVHPKAARAWLMR
ncbi:hypothetical protein NBRC116585_09500 [Thalassolituus maritimus]|uniref:Uncharacterized protein n=1 Tax=Thalassolituus maritimus TaxID=484498 RepID=A0ABP9ZXF8_9GAMM